MVLAFEAGITGTLILGRQRLLFPTATPHSSLTRYRLLLIIILVVVVGRLPHLAQQTNAP